MFAEERTKYAGQPLGLVVARDRDTAVRAAKMVTVQYEDVQKPILTIKEAIKQNRVNVATDMITGEEGILTFGDADGRLGWICAAMMILVMELHFGKSFEAGYVFS